MDGKDSVVKSVENIITSVLHYAEGENPDNRNFFKEMEADPQFSKSYEKLETYQKKNQLSDTEVIQTQLINMMIEEDFFFNQATGEYRYFEEDTFRSSELLRAAGKSEGPAMIKAHRRLQLNSFGKKATKDSQGLSVVHKDPEYKAKDDEIKRMNEIADILSNKFFYMNGEVNPNFGKVLGATYQDWFDLDKICFYIWRDSSGKPLGMFLIDPLCVKHILPNRYSPNRWDDKEVQEITADLGMEKVYQDEFRYLLINRYKTRIAKFTRKSMVVSHFFKGSSVQDVYKGCSVIEQSLRIVTSIINTLEMKSTQMTNNRVPNGILALQGASNINQVQLERFKKLLWAQSQGASNRWKVPVIGLPEKNQLQWVSFSEVNAREGMHFEWASLCFTIMCRISGTDPEELSLASNRGTLQGKNSMFQSGQEGIYRRSRDTGLTTFLNQFSEYFINDMKIIQDLGGSEDWVSKFEGLDKQDEKEREDLYTKSLANHASINEIMAQEGKKPYKLELGGLNVYDVPGIGNQQVFQLLLTAIQQKQQEEMMEQQQGEQAAMGGQPPGAEGVSGGEGEGEQEMPEISENDLALLQKYGISGPGGGPEEAVEKSALKEKEEMIEIVLE